MVHEEPSIPAHDVGVARYAHRMHEGRRDFRTTERLARPARPARGLLIAELLLIAASGLVVWITHLGWAPCAGSMLEGTQFDPTPHDWNFTEACTAAMDHGDGFPISGWLESPLQQTVNGLNALALLLLGVAWLALVRGWGVRGRGWLLASLPGLANLGLAGVAAAAFVWPPAGVLAVTSVGMLMMDLAGIIGVIAVMASAGATHSTASWIRVVLLGLAVTAAGFGHLMTDYLVMTSFSEANWDSPPGTGFLTAFSIGVFALLSMIVGAVGRLVPPRPSRRVAEPAAAA